MTALIAERLCEAARMVSPPLARNLSGVMTAFGQHSVNEVDAILRDLPTINARTEADAVALVSIAGNLLGLFVANADPRNDTATAVTFSLAQALANLKTCLSGLAERPVSDFGVGVEAGKKAASVRCYVNSVNPSFASRSLVEPKPPVLQSLREVHSLDKESRQPLRR